MNTHELKVYPYHLAFLKNFPELTAWLDCRGYTVMHSHQDFVMGVIYTFWSDYTTGNTDAASDDGENHLVVAYCLHCQTVEVYQRKIITLRENEKQLVSKLDQMSIPPAEPEHDSCTDNAECASESLAREIENLLDGTR